VSEASDADTVVGRLGDGARHVGAVAVEVVGCGVIVDEVPARHETRGGEILHPPDAFAIAVGDTRVDHGNDHRGVAPFDVPGGLGSHGGHVPLLGEVGVVRGEPRPNLGRRPGESLADGRDPVDIVRLGKPDPRESFGSLDGLRERRTRRELHHSQRRVSVELPKGRPERARRGLEIRPRGHLLEGDDDLTLHIAARLKLCAGRRTGKGGC